MLGFDRPNVRRRYYSQSEFTSSITATITLRSLRFIGSVLAVEDRAWRESVYNPARPDRYNHAVARNAGRAPDSDAVVASHQDRLTASHTPTDEPVLVARFTDYVAMFVSDGRFTADYGGPCGAKFVRPHPRTRRREFGPSVGCTFTSKAKGTAIGWRVLDLAGMGSETATETTPPARCPTRPGQCAAAAERQVVVESMAVPQGVRLAGWCKPVGSV